MSSLQILVDYLIESIEKCQAQPEHINAWLYFCQLLPLKWEVEFCICPYLLLQITGFWQYQLEGIGIMDKGVQRGTHADYGALGVGGLKMKIHKASVAALFESNHRFLDCQEMLTIGSDILAAQQSV